GRIRFSSELENMAENCLQFVPSRVDGLPNVTAAAGYSEKLELQVAGEWVVIRFDDIAKWPRPAWLWRFFVRIGWCRKWVPVGERDWFHPPRDRFFRFFTSPRLTLY